MDRSLQPKRGILYPLLVAAAVTVILLSALGIAALTGILPLAHSESARNFAPLVPPTLGTPRVPLVGPRESPAAPGSTSPPRAEERDQDFVPVRRYASHCADCGTVQAVVAYAGAAPGSRYRVEVRMDAGAVVRTFYLYSPPWRTGERVQVSGRGSLVLLHA
ncbi:MAG: hypothetical protein KF778_11705 [Rhodocyclaceae bacterium]|nr:hypothetical protein [Rhodocyclaceae bacterium]MBX3669061.1 hypothetical protein [Rhodocyclaceae bacterium]